MDATREPSIARLGSRIAVERSSYGMKNSHPVTLSQPQQTARGDQRLPVYKNVAASYCVPLVLRKNAIQVIGVKYEHESQWHVGMIALVRLVLRLVADLIGLLVLAVTPRRSVEAENLALRRQLALFREHGLKPRRIDAAARLSLAWLSRLCEW